MNFTRNLIRKNILIIAIFNWVFYVHAQTSPEIIDVNIATAIDLNNADTLSFNLKPLLDSMATKRIVALGEGTHGTSEFYKVRTEITKKLITEKGFNTICFENSYGDTYFLNLALDSGRKDYSVLMKSYLLGIWQSQEVKELIQWLQTYNEDNSPKVQLMGMDYAEINNSAKVVQLTLATVNSAELNTLADSLAYYSNYEDNVWNNQNNRKFKMNRKEWLRNGRAAYNLILRLQQKLETGNLPLPGDLKNKVLNALLSCQSGFDIFAAALQNRASSRDSLMAEMVTSVFNKNPGSKIIIWAHNVHIAKQRTYNDANGGGSGMFIERNFPHQYFALATLTASGTFSGTTDQFDSKNNLFQSSVLQAPVSGSLEEKLSGFNLPALYIDLKKQQLPEIKYRVIGYGINSGPETFVSAKLNDCYDALIFIKETHASNHDLN